MSKQGSPSGMSQAAGVPVSTPVGKPRAGGWLTVFAVTAIGLGLLHTFGAVSKLATPASLDFQRRMLGSGPATDPASQAHAELARATREIFDRYRTVVLVTAATKIPVGVVLVVAGVACLGLRRWGRRLLAAGFTAGLLVELGLARPLYALQNEVMTLNEAFFERTMQSVSSAGAGTAVEQVTRTMDSFVRMSGTAARIGFLLLSAVAALACAAGALYMLHARTRARFEASAPPTS